MNGCVCCFWSQHQEATRGTTVSSTSLHWLNFLRLGVHWLQLPEMFRSPLIYLHRSDALFETKKEKSECPNLYLECMSAFYLLLLWLLKLSTSVSLSKYVCCFSMLLLSLIPTLFYLCVFTVLLDSRTAYCFYCGLQ